MERSLHEIFTDVAKETSINKKSAILQEHDSKGLQIFLRCVFDDKVTWLVPDSKPPYEPNDAPEWDLAESSRKTQLPMPRSRPRLSAQRCLGFSCRPLNH